MKAWDSINFSDETFTHCRIQSAVCVRVCMRVLSAYMIVCVCGFVCVFMYMCVCICTHLHDFASFDFAKLFFLYTT